MRLLGIALLSLLCGCSLFVGRSDYADYREVRLARDEHARLLAMQRYVANHPDGHYHAEVQAARSAQEVAVFRAGRGTREGLERYLAAFPDGAFSDQARARLSAIALIEQQASDQRARDAQLAAERSARQAELRRTWVTRFARYWGRTLLGLTSWGASIPDVAQANPVFSRAFGAEPKPRCTRDECVKYYDSAYAVPVPGGTRIERSLSLVLRLRMREGKLERAELLLPGRGFSRWYELEHRKLVVDADAESRNAAVAWAMESLAPLLTELGDAVRAEDAYVLAPIERPAVGPSGHLVDTAAEDPGSPPNRLAAADGAETTTSVAELVKPDEQPAADMVFAPVRIDEQGRARRAEPGEPAAQAPAAGEGAAEMVMAPVLIGKSGEAVASQQPLPAPADVDAAPASAVVRSSLWHGLRIVRFAAAGDDTGPAYDGLVIERAAPAR